MEKLNFDQSIEKLEQILNKLENEGTNLSDEETNKLLEEAEALKGHCKELLKKEKEEIINTARENNIPLSEIGISEEDEFEEESEDDSEEDENK